jgi:putative ABC transport system substrate-binding protein
VKLFYAGDNVAAVTLKAATTTIPIVFRIGGDPIQLGLVPSLNRPGGNLTGVSFLTTTTGAIRLQMLHEAVPNAAVMGLLINPANPQAEPGTREAQEAARGLSHVVGASSVQRDRRGFHAIVQRQALVVDGILFLPDVSGLLSHSPHAMRDYGSRGFPTPAAQQHADRLGGVYVGRILKGDNPADLPVQSVKVG